ncbi:microtubule-associated protein futsch isoform X2 [Drosophila nasuta]|uniref:microtubule-associated protein futsch isoform X2 n=1 Tax=Drosophila nasuta TaxID=42062 RepID=UPI00295EBC18|nr:microtubule-associated protein futsch isoform X2 [Drosophila nasuta]
MMKQPIESEEQDVVGPPGQTPIPRRSSRRYSTDQNTVGLTPRRSVRRASMEATNKLEQCLKPTRRASCSAAVEIPTTTALATPKRKRRLTEELLTPSRKSQRLLCTTPKRAAPIDESVGDMGAIIEEDGVNADVLPIVTDEDYGTELPTKDADEPDKIDYHGMRELLKTPKSCSTPRFKGLREMVRTPKVCPSPMLGNIEELLETPSTPKRSVTVSRVELELSKAEATDDAQDKYFTTPRGKNLMIPNDPASAVLKTINKSLATTTEYDLNATNATLHLDKIFDDVLVAESTDPSIVVNNSENEINVTAISTAAASEADPLSTTTNPEASDTAGSEVLMNVCYAETSHKDPLTSTAFKDGGKTNLNLSALNDDSCADRAKSSDVCEMSGIQVLDQTTDSMFSERLVLTGVESCDVTLEETKAMGNNIPEEKKDELAEGSDTDSMVGLAEPLVLSDDEDVVEEGTNSNQDLIKDEKSNDFIIPPKEIPKNQKADKSVVDQSQDETVAEVSDINSLQQKEERSIDLTDVENDVEDKLESTLGAVPSINDDQNNDQDTEISNNPNESQEENDFEIDLEASSISTDVSISQIEVTQTSTIYGVDMSQVSSNIQGKETDKEDSMIQGVLHVEQSTENVVNKTAAILTDKDNNEDLLSSNHTKSVEAITENDESMGQLVGTEANTTDAVVNLNASSDGTAAELTLESANESLLNDSCEFNKSSIGLNKTGSAAETKRESIYVVPTAEASANPSDKPENDAAPRELSVELTVKDESIIDASTTVAEESSIETSFVKNKSELCEKQVEDAIVTNDEEISDHYENSPSIKHVSKISGAAVEKKNEVADEENLEKNATYANPASPIPTTSEVDVVLEIKDVVAVVEDVSESEIKLDASVLDEEEKEQLPDDDHTTQMTNEDSSIEKNTSIVVKTENNESQIDNQASDISCTTSANGTRQPQVDLESTSAEDSISAKTTEDLAEHVQEIAEMSLNLHEVAKDAKNQSAETSKSSLNLSNESETDLEATNGDVSLAEKTTEQLAEHIQDISQMSSNLDEVAKETLPESSVNSPNEAEVDLEATNVDCSLAETTSDEHIRDIADTSTNLDKAPTEIKDQAEKISLSSVTAPNESQDGLEATTADDSLTEKTKDQLAENIQGMSQMSSNLDEVAKETLPESSVNSPNEAEFDLDATNVDKSVAKTISDEDIQHFEETSSHLDEVPTKTKDQAEKISSFSISALNESQADPETKPAKTNTPIVDEIVKNEEQMDNQASEKSSTSSANEASERQVDLEPKSADDSSTNNATKQVDEHIQDLDEDPKVTTDQSADTLLSSLIPPNESQVDLEAKNKEDSASSNLDEVQNIPQDDLQCSTNADESLISMDTSVFVDLDKEEDDRETSKTPELEEQVDKTALQNVSTLDDRSAIKSTLDESVIELDDDSDKEKESLIEKDSESISKSPEETSINLDNTEVINHEESTAVDNSVINLDVSVANQSEGVTPSTTAEKSTNGTIGNEANANLESTNIDESLVDLSSSDVTDIENNEAVSDVPKITPAEADIENEETVSTDVSEILPSKTEDAIVAVPEVLLSSAESDVVAEIPVSDVPEEIKKEETVSDVSEILTSMAEDAIVAEVETKEEVSNVPEVLSSSAESDVAAEIQKKGRVSDVPEDSARIDESTADKHNVMKEAPLTIEAPLENVQSCLAASTQENEDLSKEYVFEESLTTSELDTTNQNVSNISSQSAPACGDMEEKSSQPIQESAVEEEATNSKKSTPSVSIEVDDATEKLDAEIDSIRYQNNDSKAIGKTREESKVTIDLDASCSAEITEKSLSMDTIAKQIPSASGMESELDISQKTMLVDCENTTSQTEEKEPDHVMSEVPSQSKESKSTPTDEATVEILDSDEEDMTQNRKSTENAAKNSESSATIEVPTKSAEPELALETDNNKVDLEKCLNVPSTTIQSESSKHDAKKLPTSPNELIQLAPTIESTPTVESTEEIIDSEEEAKEMEMKPAKNVDNNISQLMASPSTIASTSIDIKPKQSDELAEEISNDNDGAEKSTANAASSRSAPSTNDDYKDGSPSETVSEPAVEIIDSDGDVSNQSKIIVDEAVKNSPPALEKNSAIENQVEKHANQYAGIEIEVSKKHEVETESSQKSAPSAQLVASDAKRANQTGEKIEARSKTEEVVIDISSSDEESLTHATSQKVNQVSHEKVVLESDGKFRSDDKEILTEQHSLEIENSSDLIMDANPMNVLKRRRKSSTYIETLKDTTKMAQATPKRRGRKDDLVHEDIEQIHFTMEVHKVSRNVEETTDSSHKSHPETVDLEKPSISRRKSITKNVETEVKKGVKATTSQPETNTDKPKRRGRKPATEITETEVHEKLSETIDLNKPKCRGRKSSGIDALVVEIDSPIEVKQQESVDLDKPKQRERKSSAMLAVTESQVVEETTVEAAETVDTEIPTEPKRRGRKQAKIVEAKVISSTEVSEIESEMETKEVIKVDIQTKEQQGKVENLEKPKPRGRKPSIGETEIPAGDKPSRAGRKPSAEIAETKDYVAEVNELEKPKRRIRKASAEVVEATANLDVKKYELNRRASVDVAIVEQHEAVIHKEKTSTIEAVKDNPRRRNRKVSSEVTEALEPINQTEKKPARNTRKASAETVEIDNEEKEHLPVIVEATEPEQKKLRLNKTTESDAAQKVNARGRKKSVSAEQPPEAVEVSGSREKTTTRRGRKATNDEPMITPPAEFVEATTSHDKTTARRGRKATNDEPLAIPPAEIVEATTSRGKSENRRGHEATVEAEPLPTPPAEIVKATTLQEKSATRRGRKATNDEALSTTPAEIVEPTTSRGKSANRRGHKTTVEEEPLPTPPAEIVEATTSQEKTTARRGRKVTNDEPQAIPPAEIVEVPTSRGKSANRRGPKATVQEEPSPTPPAEIVEATTSQDKTTARRGRKATNDEALSTPPAEIVEATTSKEKTTARRGRKVTNDEPQAIPPAEILEATTSRGKSANRRGHKATVEEESSPTPPAEIVEATTSQEKTTARRGRKATNDEPLAIPPVEILEATTSRGKSANRRGHKATVQEESSPTPSAEIVEATTSQEKTTARRGRKATNDEPLAAPLAEIVEATTRRGRKATVEEETLSTQPEIVEVNSQEKSAIRSGRKATVDEEVPSVQADAAELKPKRRARKASAEIVHAEVQPLEPTEQATRRARGASADVAAETDPAVEKQTTRRVRKPSANVDVIVEEATPPKKAPARRGRKASLSAAVLDEVEKQDHAIELATVASAIISPRPQVLSSEDELTPRRREGRNLPRKNYDETSDEDKPGSSRKARKPVASKAAAVSPLPKPTTPTKQKSSVEIAVEPVAGTQTPIATIIPIDLTSSQKREGRNMPRKNYNETSDDEKPASSRGRRIRQPTIKALELLVDSASRPVTPKRRGKAKAADTAAAATEGDADTDEPPEKKIILEDSTPIAAKARGGARGRKVHNAEEVTEAEPAKRGARSRKESATIQVDETDIEVEVKQPAKRNERGGGARKAKADEDAADGQPPIKKVRGGARAKTPVVAESVANPNVEEPKEVPVTKRATAARGRNARVAKVVDEVVTITETPPTRTGRGRKVHFEAIEDTASVAVTVAKEAPQPVADEAPKRATRSRRK